MKKVKGKKILLVFLGATLFYSVVDSLRSYGGEKAVPGKVIYYDMPHCRVPTGKAFGGKMVSSLFKLNGKNDGKAPFGHAGIIVEDNHGNLTLYQYGRFKSGIGYVLPSLKGNWQKMALGKRGNRSDRELIRNLAPGILSKLPNSGNRLNAYIMKTDDITPTVNYIEREACKSNRKNYFLFYDYTCGGAARSAFDRSRSFPGRVLSKWAYIVGNFIPLPAHIWSACTHNGNISGLTGLSPEGNAPSLFTEKVVYKSDFNEILPIQNHSFVSIKPKTKDISANE